MSLSSDTSGEEADIATWQRDDGSRQSNMSLGSDKSGEEADIAARQRDGGSRQSN
jgi:hypothetical protein